MFSYHIELLIIGYIDFLTENSSRRNRKSTNQLPSSCEPFTDTIANVPSGQTRGHRHHRQMLQTVPKASFMLIITIQTTERKAFSSFTLFVPLLSHHIIINPTTPIISTTLQSSALCMFVVNFTLSSWGRWWQASGILKFWPMIHWLIRPRFLNRLWLCSWTLNWWFFTCNPLLISGVVFFVPFARKSFWCDLGFV